MCDKIDRFWRLKRQILLTVIVVVVTCGMATLLIVFSHRDYETIPLQEHWKVTIDSRSGQEYQDVSIWDAPFDKADKKDAINLSIVLPENRFVQPELALRVSHCALDVYLDQELLYSYGEELYKNEKLLGSGYFLVPLPEDYEGKTLSIRLRKVAESKFNYMEDTCIISAGDALKRLITDNFLSVVISIFLIAMGLIELCSVFFLFQAKKPIRSMISISAFSLLMSFWMSCCNKTMQFLISDYGRLTVVEYVAMYLLPVGVISISYAFFTKPMLKKVVRVAEVWFLLLAFVAIITQALHLVNLLKYAAVFRASLLIVILLAVLFMIEERNVPRVLEEKIEISGLAIFLIFVFFETLRYCFKKNYDFLVIGNQSLLPVGVLIWIVTMLIRFTVAMYRGFVSELQQELLKKMAYTDALTALSNRAKCEEVMQDYAEKKCPILIINMDLNNFKNVNDTYGHSEGDRMLCAFANILEEVFREVATVGRMGGDEFIVIMDASKKAYVEEILHKLTQRVNEYNMTEKHPYLLQFAYGYATNEGESALTPWDVYKKADAKMYRCKRKQKI